MLPHPALHASHAGIWLATADGTRAVSRAEAIRTAAETPVILLNAPLVGQRLGYAELSGLDLLELFAFLHPARFAVPTPAGLARAVDLSPPDRDEDVAGVEVVLAAAAEATDPHAGKSLDQASVPLILQLGGRHHHDDAAAGDQRVPCGGEAHEGLPRAGDRLDDATLLRGPPRGDGFALPRTQKRPHVREVGVRPARSDRPRTVERWRNNR